jgi:hypothetical protein
LPSRDIALAQRRKDKSSQRKAVRMQARSPKQGLSAWQAWLRLQAGHELGSFGSFFLLYVWQLLQAVNSPHGGVPNSKTILAINGVHRCVRQKASVAHLLAILKIDRAQPRQLQRMQPKASDRRPNSIREEP